MSRWWKGIYMALQWPSCYMATLRAQVLSSSILARTYTHTAPHAYAQSHVDPECQGWKSTLLGSGLCRSSD